MHKAQIGNQFKTQTSLLDYSSTQNERTEQSSNRTTNAEIRSEINSKLRPRCSIIRVFEQTELNNRAIEQRMLKSDRKSIQNSDLVARLFEYSK